MLFFHSGPSSQLCPLSSQSAASKFQRLACTFIFAAPCTQATLQCSGRAGVPGRPGLAANAKSRNETRSTTARENFAILCADTYEAAESLLSSLQVGGFSSQVNEPPPVGSAILHRCHSCHLGVGTGRSQWQSTPPFFAISTAKSCNALHLNRRCKRTSQ